jgi:hypothetical protein
MDTRKYFDLNLHLRVPLWQPTSPGTWRVWLPSRGNVLFTLLVVAGLLWASSVGALSLRAPAAAGTSTGTIAYQGRLADADGNPLTGTYNMIFRLYDVASGGVPLWEEQWTGSNSVRVSDGLFNVMLGSLTPIPQSVVTGNSSLWLGITVGTDDEMTPRVQLGSVPFAVQALTVPDGSVTTAKIADGAVNSRIIANGSVEPADVSLNAWGIAARTQGLIVMPEGPVTDNGAGDITFGGTLIVMNPMAGTFIRAAAGTYHLDPYGYLYVNLPPSVAEYALVTPQVEQWRHGVRPFDGTDRFLLAQRAGGGKVWFRFGWITP